MNGFLAFVVRGRTQAIVVATLAMLLPLTSFVSAAVVGLVTLRYGMADGALVLVATLAASSGLGWLVFGELQGVVAFAVLLGLPVLMLAGVLRATASQGLMLTAAGALGAVVISGIHLLTGDPAAWWRGLLTRHVLEPA